MGIFSFQIIPTFGGNGSGNENHDFNPPHGGSSWFLTLFILIIFVLFMALLYFKIIPVLKKYFEKKKKKKLTKGKESIYEYMKDHFFDDDTDDEFDQELGKFMNSNTDQAL